MAATAAAPSVSPEAIEAKARAALAGTPYAVTSMRKLTGGTANLIYHAQLEVPQPEASDGVVVKQGEAFVASNPNFPLSTSRCPVEEQCMTKLAELAPVTTPSCAISTPRMLYFNAETNTQVHEYLRDAVSLKDYALEHYAAVPTPTELQPQCRQLGNGLGRWLRAFHDWSGEPARAGLREVFAGNREMQIVKNWINYKQLVQMADRYPEILGDVKPMLQAISDMAAGELADNAALRPIHGDFWTGNVLLPNQAIREGSQTPVRIVDWELAQVGVVPLDLGQMIAELWQLKLYKGIDAGEWIIDAFARGYGAVDAEFAFRTIIHVGVHFVVFGSQTPGWGTTEQKEQLIETAKQVLQKAWAKDREWFKGHVLECLFGDS